MPGVSIHVVDVARGIVARGMKVEFYRCSAQGSECIAAGLVSAGGLLEAKALDARFSPGTYEARFHVMDYYLGEGIPLPSPAFLDVVAYRFGIADAEAHYHLPMKLTPWGYSCFRGGA